MGEKQEARETGEDLERKRAWDYSIEDNENWDKKQEKKGRRADTGFAGKTMAKLQRCRRLGAVLTIVECVWRCRLRRCRSAKVQAGKSAAQPKVYSLTPR